MGLISICRQVNTHTCMLIKCLNMAEICWTEKTFERKNTTSPSLALSRIRTGGIRSSTEALKYKCVQAPSAASGSVQVWQSVGGASLGNAVGRERRILLLHLTRKQAELLRSQSRSLRSGQVADWLIPPWGSHYRRVGAGASRGSRWLGFTFQISPWCVTNIDRTALLEQHKEHHQLMMSHSCEGPLWCIYSYQQLDCYKGFKCKRRQNCGIFGVNIPLCGAGESIHFDFRPPVYSAAVWPVHMFGLWLEPVCY